MKENSIEEDMKIINNFITYFNKNIQNGNKADLTVLGEEINAIENILSDYKRVLKKNEELKNQEATQSKINELLVQRYSNSISVQKIKDKIKKNKNLVEESNDGDIIRKLNQENEVLQDLLEEEKQWEKYIKAGN